MLRKVVLLITIIMVVMSMGACGNTSNKTEPKGEYQIITSGEYNFKVKPEQGAIIQDYVNDAATAQQIADAVIQSIIGEEKFKQLVGITVSYDSKNELWVVTRKPEPIEGHIIAGGDYSCAIRRNNGEILKVWAGE